MLKAPPGAGIIHAPGRGVTGGRVFERGRMDTHLVFVYGTLRRGGARAMRGLFPGSVFVGGASAGGGSKAMG